MQAELCGESGVRNLEPSEPRTIYPVLFPQSGLLKVFYFFISLGLRQSVTGTNVLLGTSALNNFTISGGA